MNSPTQVTAREFGALASQMSDMKSDISSIKDSTKTIADAMLRLALTEDRLVSLTTSLISVSKKQEELERHQHKTELTLAAYQGAGSTMKFGWNATWSLVVSCLAGLAVFAAERISH